MAASVIVIGAGPAGLAAAWECVKHGTKPVVLEANAEVGGICRIVEHEGFRFDIGARTQTYMLNSKMAWSAAPWKE